MLARELARPTWEGASVVVGAATDPYQPAEGRYRLTRACLEVFAAAPNPFSIITRGPMIVRDIDVLQQASRRANVTITFSIPTLDDDVWRKSEPSTAHPRQRLRAIRELTDAGIDARVGMAPILPGVSDRPEQLAEVVRAAREAGATGIWANVLFLRPGTREHFLESLAEHWPEQLPLYERLYANGRAYLPSSETKPVRAEVSRLAREHAHSGPAARSARAAGRARAARARGVVRPVGIRSPEVTSEITVLIVDDHEVVREGSSPLTLADAAHPRRRRGARRQRRARPCRAAASRTS